MSKISQVYLYCLVKTAIITTITVVHIAIGINATMDILKRHFSYLYLVNDKSPKVMQDDKKKSSLQVTFLKKLIFVLDT